MKTTSINNQKEIPIVFILAKGRSGTTLLQTMLDAHSEIIAPFESRFVAHFQNRYASITNWTPTLKNRFIKDVLGEMKISFFWEIEHDVLFKRVHALPQVTSYAMLCRQVYLSSKSFFEKQTPKVIVDKNPIYALLIPLLTKIFPEARFIHCVRDFRANCASFHKFHPQKSMTELGYMWNRYNIKIEVLKQKYPHKFHTINYEDLVTKPSQTLSSICDFLHVRYQPSMLLYHEKVSKFYAAYVERSQTTEIKHIRELGAQTVHKNLSEPLNPNLINNWKKKLSEDQVTTLEKICGAVGKMYGYNVGFNEAEIKTPPLKIVLNTEKLLLYYSLPIWLRELKSKPNLALIPKK